MIALDIQTDRTVLAWEGDQLMEASMFEDLSNPVLLGIGLLAGGVLGALIVCALVMNTRANREDALKRQVAKQGKIIEALLNEINRLARKPINLNGDERAYQQISERV